MNKEETIRRYGKAAYEKKLQQGRDWAAQHPKECNARNKKWRKEHPGTIYQKTLDIFTGTEEGGNWSIRIKIDKIGVVRAPYIWQSDPFKVRIRSKDKQFFRRHLSSSFMKGKEIDHDWDNGAVCSLLTHAEHQNIEEGRR